MKYSIRADVCGVGVNGQEFVPDGGVVDIPDELDGLVADLVATGVMRAEGDGSDGKNGKNDPERPAEGDGNDGRNGKNVAENSPEPESATAPEPVKRKKAK